MRNNKHILYFILSLIILPVSKTAGQATKIETLYISTSPRTVLNFPATVTFCDFVDKAANAWFYKRVSNSIVSIYAKTENARPAVLKVTEGKRTHFYNVVYKKQLALDELVYRGGDLAASRNIIASFESENSNTFTVSERLRVNKSDQKRPSNKDLYSKSRGTFIPPDNKAKKYREAVAKEEPKDKLMYGKDKERTVKYDSAIAKATLALANGEYELALNYYREASSLQPQETFPHKMIAYAESARPSLARIKQHQDDLKRKAHVVELLDTALTEVMNKNYESATALYQKVLTLRPTWTQEVFVRGKIDAINLEMKRIGRQPLVQEQIVAGNTPKKNPEEQELKPIEEQRKEPVRPVNTLLPVDTAAITIATATTATETANKSVALTPRVADIKKAEAPIPSGSSILKETSAGKSAPDFYAREALPYKKEDLDKKYPNIDFLKMPEGQAFDSTDKENEASNHEISKQLLIKTPKFDISDGNNDVKVMFQGVTFSGKNIYIKLLIRNYSTTNDFVTGQLQLMHIRNSGGLKKLNPRYVSDFPIVLPETEFPIVYAAEAPKAIAPNESFIFQVQDRIRKNKFSLFISGNLIANN